MKVLFLDMDGVINSERYKLIYTSPYYLPDLDNIDPAAVALLDAFLLANPSILVVICSTWRMHHSLDKIKEALRKNGLSSADRIIDQTPRLQHTTNKGEEIKSWLTLHPEVTHYAALDDGEDLVIVKAFQVQTSMETGVTEKDLKKLAKFYEDKP